MKNNLFVPYMDKLKHVNDGRWCTSYNKKCKPFNLSNLIMFICGVTMRCMGIVNPVHNVLRELKPRPNEE